MNCLGDRPLTHLTRAYRAMFYNAPAVAEPAESGTGRLGRRPLTRPEPATAMLSGVAGCAVKRIIPCSATALVSPTTDGLPPHWGSSGRFLAISSRRLFRGGRSEVETSQTRSTSTPK